VNPGDRVIYTLEHYEWLCLAGRWPRGLHRPACSGVVMWSDSDLVQVEWPDRAAGTRILVHLAGNLEAAA
jgi:hypothetical protein